LLLIFIRKFNFYYYIRYYHANVDEVHKKIKELTKEGEWSSDEFSEMKQNLLNKLNMLNLNKSYYYTIHIFHFNFFNTIVHIYMKAKLWLLKILDC